MSTDALGTARVDIALNTEAYELGISRAKTATSGFSKDFQQQQAQMSAAQRRVTESLAKQTDTLRLGGAERLAYNIGLKTTGTVSQELLQKLNATSGALKTNGIQFNEYGLSVKQTAAALRQVPAQMTDIFVSLQGGQKPLTVLLQQGGQLKDVFGGIVPAAKALGGAVLGLITPYTLAAAAAVGLVLALNDIEKQQAAISNSLILTGNSAGVTTDQLNSMAVAIDNASTATERSASSVVAKVAQTGKFTAAQIQQVALAAVQMEESTGRAIDKTIADFESLQGDPLKAIQKLSFAASDGTNFVGFLTEAIQEQIRELEKQGKSAEATALAISTMAGVVADRAPQITGNLTSISQVWRVISEQANTAVVGTLNALRDLDQAAARYSKHITDLLKSQGDFLHIGSFIDSIVADPRKAAVAPTPRTGTGKIADPVAEQANLAFEAIHLANLSKAKTQELEILKIKALGLQAHKTQAQIDTEVAISNKHYLDSLPKKHSDGIAGAQSKLDLQEFKSRLLEEQAAITAGTRVLQAQYSARTVTSEEYYTRSRELMQRDTKAQEAALNGEIASLRGRTVAGKDALGVQKQITELEGQLSKVRLDGATNLEVLKIGEAEFYRQRALNLSKYKQGLDNSTIALKQQTEAAIRHVGMGDQEFADAERINAAYIEQTLRLQDLQNALDSRTIDRAFYDEQVRLQKETTDEQVRIIKRGYEEMDAAQASWLNGFKSGLSNWMDGAADVASQVSAITTRSLDSAADAFANFALTGKLAIKDLLRSILSDIVKFLAKKAILQFLQAFAGGASGNNFGVPAQGSGRLPGFASGNSFLSGTTLPSNTVLTKATLFRFANGGAFGEAGEAGPEAIMPLKRGANGRLGVQVTGGGGAVNINVNTVVNSDGTKSNTTSDGNKANAYKEFTNEMRGVAEQTIQKALRPGGTLWRAGVAA